MKKTFKLAVLALLTTSLSWAAPLFPDVPSNHWAQDAVADLAAKGLIEGYPDGSFKGDRAASRWETATIIARALARLEQANGTFALKSDLEQLRKLAEAYREELAAIGVRVGNLEEMTGRLDQRVTELERIRFYGRVHFVAASQNVRGNSPNFGTAANPGIDWSTGRLLTEGTGMSSMAILGINADVSDDFVAGMELVGYASQGDQTVDSYWGVSAPFAANPWTGRGATAPGLQPDNNTPFTRMVLDNFWLTHKPSKTRLTVGSYFTTHMPSYVMNGPRNPNIHKPRWLPYNGMNLRGTIAGPNSGWKYEAMYSVLPTASTYHTHTFGGTLKYEFKEKMGHVAVSMARTQDERIADGVIQGVGGPIVVIPSVPFTGPGAPAVATNTWLDTRPGVPVARTAVGPQQQNTLGVDFGYKIWKEPKLRIFGEFGTSDYNPDHSTTSFNTSVNGTLLKFGLSAQPTEGLDLRAEYMSVDPTYDPFVVAYPLAPNLPVFLPYGGYYSAYYQLHDYVNSPNNREGFKLAGSYLFNEDRTRVSLNFQHLEQKKATTFNQIQKVGNVEPLFPVIQTAGIATKGKIDSFGVGVSHHWSDKFFTKLNYNNYGISRNTVAIDDVDLSQEVYKLTANYKIDELWNVRANYYHLSYRGHSGLLNSDFTQSIPGIGVDYDFDDNATVSLDYRIFDLNDRALPINSYDGDQLLLEMKLDF